MVNHITTVAPRNHSTFPHPLRFRPWSVMVIVSYVWAPTAAGLWHSPSIRAPSAGQSSPVLGAALTPPPGTGMVQGMMTDSGISLGSKVWLNSGSPEMTVEKTTGSKARCSWVEREGGRKKYYTFPSACLTTTEIHVPDSIITSCLGTNTFSKK